MRETFMPYQAHPSFTEPEPGTARLWRYMDLAQFLLILEKEELFFPSVATLAEADPYEGEPLPAKRIHLPPAASQSQT